MPWGFYILIGWLACLAIALLGMWLGSEPALEDGE